MKVVLRGDYASRQAERLRRLLDARFAVVALPDHAAKDEVRRHLADAAVLVSNHFDANLPPTPALRLLQSPSAGVEGINLHEAAKRGVPIAVATGHEPAMAEYVLAAMLSHAIGLRALAESMADGLWTTRHRTSPAHGELAGRTVGLLGYGGVAREIARRCAGFGVNVRALSRWSRTHQTDDVPVERYPTDKYSDFLGNLDYLVVTVPLNSETEGLVDGTWFDAMPSQCILVNVSRGPVVCEEALFNAVSQRRIGGAILDVWYRYPNADDQVPPSRFPFHTLDAVVMTPHASGRTEGTFERRWMAIGRNIEAVAEGRGLAGVLSVANSGA